MFNIGLFKTIRDLLGMFSGFISAGNKVGNIADKLATVGESSVDIMLDEVERSRVKAQLAYEAELAA